MIQLRDKSSLGGGSLVPRLLFTEREFFRQARKMRSGNETWGGGVFAGHYGIKKIMWNNLKARNCRPLTYPRSSIAECIQRGFVAFKAKELEKSQ